MKKSARMVLAFILASLLTTATACGGAPKDETGNSANSTSGQTQSTATAAEKPDPYGKMPELVTFTTGRTLATDPKIPEGESLDNNDLVKYIEEKVNVRQNIIWTTSDMNYAYENKINMLIASSDIPDVLQINTVPYGMSILKKLVENDMIMDLTPVYNDYASPSFKEHHEAAGNIALNSVRFDGKLMALPNISDTQSAIPIMWVRQDWLDKLKLPAPRTIDDFAAIAKAFIEQDPDGNGKADTLGLVASSTPYKGDTATFDFLFNAYKSFPGDWIKDSSGNVVYGSTTAETKQALAKLQEWYKTGLIDKEFALKDPGKATEAIVNGKAGIVNGAWWSPWWPLNTSVQNDPKAEWKAYGVQAVDGKYYGKGTPPASNFVVIKKGFKNPEAIIKANNYIQDAELGLNDWYNQLKATGGKYATLATQLWPVQISAKYADEISRRWTIVKDTLDGKSDPAKLDPQSGPIYSQIKANREQPKKNLDAWMNDIAWSSGAEVILANKYQQVFPVFSGTTDTMSKMMTPMNDLEKDTILKIIMNKQPVDSFDSFVTQWKQMGGDKITAEVAGLVK